MANEKKATEQATQETQETQVQVQVQENVDKLLVEREVFNSKDGREMYGYFVRGKIRGRDVKVDFNAKDQGGYEVLDIIFDISPTAQLTMHDEEMTNEDGTKQTYTVYEVSNTDEDGIVYSYKIKPARESDKAYLSVLLQQIAKRKAG